MDRNNNDVSNAADHNNGAVREPTVNNNSSSYNSIIAARRIGRGRIGFLIHQDTSRFLTNNMTKVGTEDVEGERLKHTDNKVDLGTANDDVSYYDEYEKVEWKSNEDDGLREE